MTEVFIFSSLFLKNSCLTELSKEFRTQIYTVLERIHVTVFLEHSISLKGKLFSSKLFAVLYKNAFFFLVEVETLNDEHI